VANNSKRNSTPDRAPRGRRPAAVGDWAPAFLGAIIEGLHVRDACAVAGVCGQMPYKRRRTDDAFAAAWQDASDFGTEMIEYEATRRAYHGTLRPVFYKGKPCGSIREYSDQLLMFLLRARKPAVYRETHKLEHSEPTGGPIRIVGIEIVPRAAPAALPTPESRCTC
jgi:hypothetical protein